MTESLPDLATLVPSWKRALRAERKSPATIKSYAEGAHAYLTWCAAAGTPAVLTKANAQDFVADMLDRGQAAKTASARLLGLAGSRRGWPTPTAATNSTPPRWPG